MTEPTVLTTKHTCDKNGNWSEVAVLLTRVGQGWAETFVPPSDDPRTAWAPKPAVVKKDKAA